MTNQPSDVSQRQAAIVAGVSIIIMAVAAVVATDLALGRLVVPGDAAATFQNIRSSEMLFRTGIFSWIIILVCDVLAAWGLYVFFKPVNKSLSLLSGWLRLVYAAILGAALVHLIHALLLVRGDAALKHKLRVTLIMTFTPPLLLVPVFRYFLLVPLPHEGGIIGIMNLIRFALR